MSPATNKFTQAFSALLRPGYVFSVRRGRCSAAILGCGFCVHPCPQFEQAGMPPEPAGKDADATPNRYRPGWPRSIAAWLRLRELEQCLAISALLSILFAFPADAVAAPLAAGVLYNTGFESTDTTPFNAGDLQGQGQWSVTEGSAVVQQATKARGAQAVQAGQAGFHLGVTTNAPVLWLDAFVLDAGSTNQPMIPSNAVSSVIFLSATQGVLALDGDGNGRGNFVQVAPGFATNEFVRISVRNDYINKTYDLWINGLRARAGLRFKDNSIPGFAGVQRRSSFDSYLDDFSVTTWGLDADSDGDGLIDLDEIKFHDSHPQLADTDGDGMNDGQEVAAGTSPADAASIFVLGIDQDSSASHQVLVPTVSGRQYTLQRRARVESGDWQDVPGVIDIPGDGSIKVFVQSSSGTNYFYRGVVHLP